MEDSCLELVETCNLVSKSDLIERAIQFKSDNAWESNSLIYSVCVSSLLSDRVGKNIGSAGMVE